MTDVQTEAGKWLLEEYARTPGDPKWFPGMGLESTIVAIEAQAAASDHGGPAMLGFVMLSIAFAAGVVVGWVLS